MGIFDYFGYQVLPKFGGKEKHPSRLGKIIAYALMFLTIYILAQNLYIMTKYLKTSVS